MPEKQYYRKRTEIAEKAEKKVQLCELDAIEYEKAGDYEFAEIHRDKAEYFRKVASRIRNALKQI
jgi:predicted solute-binding protein